MTLEQSQHLMTLEESYIIIPLSWLMADHHMMGGDAALEESYFLFHLSWLKVNHHMMGGGC